MRATIDNKEYDIKAGYMGNGLTVYNRAEDDETGDYKTIAHVSDAGHITYRDELPARVKAYIKTLKPEKPCLQS